MVDGKGEAAPLDCVDRWTPSSDDSIDLSRAAISSNLHDNERNQLFLETESTGRTTYRSATSVEGLG